MITRRYVRSPLDGQIHLLDDAHYAGGYRTRCAVAISADVHQFDQPPFGTPCENCRLALLSEMNG